MYLPVCCTIPPRGLPACFVRSKQATKQAKPVKMMRRIASASRSLQQQALLARGFDYQRNYSMDYKEKAAKMFFGGTIDGIVSSSGYDLTPMTPVEVKD